LVISGAWIAIIAIRGVVRVLAEAPKRAGVISAGVPVIALAALTFLFFPGQSAFPARAKLHAVGFADRFFFTFLALVAGRTLAAITTAAIVTALPTLATSHAIGDTESLLTRVVGRACAAFAAAAVIAALQPFARSVRIAADTAIADLAATASCAILQRRPVSLRHRGLAGLTRVEWIDHPVSRACIHYDAREHLHSVLAEPGHARVVRTRETVVAKTANATATVVTAFHALTIRRADFLERLGNIYQWLRTAARILNINRTRGPGARYQNRRYNVSFR